MIPVYKQYLRVKDENPGVILFFRIGDFYEIFGDDVEIVAPLLDQSVTTHKYKGESVKMTGFPHFYMQTHAETLIKMGYLVAMQEYKCG